MHEAKFEPFESSQGSDHKLKMESFQKAKLSSQLELSPSSLENKGSSLIFWLGEVFKIWAKI